MTKPKLDLVGLAEAAEIIGVERSTISNRRRRTTPPPRHPSFPTPIAELRCGPIWLRQQITDYTAERERLQNAIPEALENALRGLGNR